MRHFKLIITLLIISTTTNGQLITGYDAPLGKQLLLDFTVRTGADNLLKNQWIKIEERKKKTADFLTVVLVVQQKLYSSLTTVNSIISQGKMVKHAGDILQGIVQYQHQLLIEAASEPQYLLFAQEMEAITYVRAVGLLKYLKDFVIKSDAKSFLDNAKRIELLTYVIRELEIIRGTSWSALSTVKYAKQIGLLKAVNPWQDYINKDQDIFWHINLQLKVQY